MFDETRAELVTYCGACGVQFNCINVWTGDDDV